MMKKIMCVLALCGCAGLSAVASTASLESGFKKPADEYKPWTWWHWMNGHVTRESITRDLEEMKRSGLGGFGLWNTHEGIPKGPVKYGTPEWWELVEHTMNEAERLGLFMEIFNCAGWSATGAPFVTPEMAMQEVAWTEARFNGPGKAKIQLTVPKAVLGLERDMKKNPKINQRYYMPRKGLEGCFRDLAVFAVPSIPKGEKPRTLKNWREKAGFAKLAGYMNPDKLKIPKSQLIRQDQVIDLSEYMNADGFLEWEAPAGEWTILRMGYQPTGRGNHPAAHGGRGLEIDKMSAAAMDFYWEHFLSRVVRLAGDRAGTVFQNILCDSYEAGHQNWTAGFDQKFIDRHGYDLKKVLPILTGRVIQSPEYTERVLWDYRKLISDMIVGNYYGRMQENCAKAGVKFASEPYGRYGNANDFDMAGKVDIPTCEWWANLKQQDRIGEARLVASAAHTYGRKVVSSEAFTGSPKRIFESHPGGIKVQGDYFMAQGVNKFCFHTWAHDPYEQAPGLGLGTYGSRFDSRNTWWPYVGDFLEYLARNQYMLQQGKFVGDVVCYAGEDAPLKSGHLYRGGHILKDLPYSYDYSMCNTEILMQLTVKKGRLLTKNGSDFGVLQLPHSPWMSVEVLKKVEELLKAGAVISGAKPASAPGNTAKAERDQFAALTKRIWGAANGRKVKSNQYGQGVIYWGEPLSNILKKHGIAPDFSFSVVGTQKLGKTMYPGVGIDFIHRQVGADEVYFLSNQHAVTKTVKARFRVSGKVPELWFPDSGEICKLSATPSGSEHTEIELKFGPNEAYFVVFRDPSVATATKPAPWSKKEQQIADLSSDWNLNFSNGGSASMAQLQSWTKLDKLKYHSGTATYQKTFALTKQQLAKADEMLIDLGQVDVIAEVKVNGKNCGIAWKPPYRVNIANALRAGENKVEVTVANLWVNRLIGDQRFKDDHVWTTETGSTASGMGLKKIPDWVLNNSERPVKDRTAFYAWKWDHINSKKPLLSSGMLGPVKLIAR
ncbi:hypothetical protein PDESU_02068 [Pontiella desulfatans]|uniref:Beta-mannosidase-like galactose-binding domain-containing protein n=1 Tax=Pontiella desulfatans TaxID=2750659 RepID=A0A6C2U1P2_PONDE|nr:glycosyl hydrolase [Pontiella desulfatans]VGO13511.1 hypothetical protein PDESU_02068 [Pontiella desulfatans]